MAVEPGGDSALTSDIVVAASTTSSAVVSHRSTCRTGAVTGLLFAAASDGTLRVQQSTASPDAGEIASSWPPTHEAI